MKRQESVEVAFALVVEAVQALRPLLLNGNDDDLSLFLLCLNCETRLRNAMYDNNSG